MGTSFLTIILVGMVAASPPAAGPADVAITAPDGANLTATYFAAAQRGPAVLLLHQCNMTRTSWTLLAERMAAAGVHVLAPDYRGSGSNKALPADYSKRGGDIDAALEWLTRQPGVDPTRVAVGGASCGVDHAVQLARRNNGIRAMLLLSGGTGTEGLKFIRTGKVPVLLAFSVDVGGPLPAMGQAVSASPHPASKVRELSRAGHGVPMFDSDTTLLPSIVDWLVSILR